ncbi:sensor histidine kinase [Algoriphagus formosus]|uniref:sensor histidine kinase n=1 Tax=Algoriphagus formosus TaxID=2007308 RepID=UPI000C293100|nr:ATP-binding protein [Algoriphagus formosus]
MFKKITEFFIPPQKLQSGDELRSERIFVAVLLISAVSNFLGINLAIEIKAELNGYLLLINGVINLLILLAYRYGLKKSIATTLVLSQFAISFPIQAWLQGGLSSPAAAAFFLLPAVAMLIQGKRAATFWMILSAFLSLGLFWFESQFGTPVPTFDPAKSNLFYFSSILGTNLTIFIILLVYETGKSKALANIQNKNEALINTQSQLIQAEKMASLGELTAGIAHEIQNPLNFVNNFSEISNELIEEIEEEQKKTAAERDNELIFEIIADLKQNLQKINKHGHRAGSIVKNMLEHSRISTGEKVLTDINVLADEYVKLSYHGLRAKDKSFNADLKLNLAPNLPKVKILPSEIGRVLLNLANNAFYAVSEKAKGNLEGYKPQLTLSTVKTKNGIEISVSDNGPGIPESIKDKIFQPFFTTKPSGSGTGLGLSLSYDIVKAHGGEVKVESESGKGTTFRIQIPT